MLLLSKRIIINTLSFHLLYLCGTRFLPLFNSLFLLPLSSTFSPIISILMHNNHYCNNNNIITLVIIIYFTFFAIINIKIIALFFSIFMFICIISPYYSLTELHIVLFHLCFLFVCLYYHWGNPCISILCYLVHPLVWQYMCLHEIWIKKILKNKKRKTQVCPRSE